MSGYCVYSPVFRLDIDILCLEHRFILVFPLDIEILCPESPVLVFIRTLTSYLYTVLLPQLFHSDIEILYPTTMPPRCYTLDIDIR